MNKAGRKALKWLRRAMGIPEGQTLAWAAVEVCTGNKVREDMPPGVEFVRDYKSAWIDPGTGNVQALKSVELHGTTDKPLVTPPGTTVTSVTPDVTGREAMKAACATVIDVLNRCKASGGAMSYGRLQDCVTDLTRCGYTEEEARGLVARAMPVFPEKPAESQERRGYEFL